MNRTKTIADWLQERQITLQQLIEESALDGKIVQAIVAGRYTPSPQQRKRIAEVLQVEQENIAWGHVNEISHVYGHGPQFGRSP